MREGIYFPSKLADYLVARKPVLALSPHIGIVGDMTEERAVIQVDALNEEAIASVLDRLYTRFRQGILRELRPSEALARQFKPETVGKKFIAVLHQVLSNKGFSENPVGDFHPIGGKHQKKIEESEPIPPEDRLGGGA